MTEQRVPVKVICVLMEKVDAKPEEGGEEITTYSVAFEDEAQHRIEIFIGQLEAFAIGRGLENKAHPATTVPPDRPQTYEMMLKFLSVTGGVIEECYINDLRDETFYALVSLRVGDQVHEIDIRPSDAVNLAIRADCPIFIRETVFQTMRKDNASEDNASAA